MADYRFKIQGSASPFLIQLSAGTTSVCETVFEYSGCSSPSFEPDYTCAILSNLGALTCYNMKITDCVGNSYPTGGTYSFTTAESPIPVLTEINIDLLGTAYSPVNCTSILAEPKYMEITPPLTTGQCMGVNFCGVAEDGLNDTAIIEVFKRCGSGGSYSRFLCVNDGCDNCCVDLGVDDSICYNMSASLVHDINTQSYSYACTDLCIDYVSGLTNINCVTCGPNTCLNVSEICCTTTTTTTTAAAPATISWGITEVTAPAGCECKRTSLWVTPPLEAGQSFRLCFYNKIYYCFATYLSYPVTASAYEVNNLSKIGCVTFLASYLSPGPYDCTIDERGYIDVTCDNIGDISSCVQAISHIDNIGLDHVVCACTRLNSISNMVGGSYIISHALSEVSASVISGT